MLLRYQRKRKVRNMALTKEQLVHPGLGRLPMRIVEKIEERPDGCWIWTGYLNDGYGRPMISGRRRYLHRVTYESVNGPIPDGLEIDHATCQTPACCNPTHLEAVTHAENVRRGRVGENNRMKTECKRGHEFTESNTRTYRSRRHCRECQLITQRERRAKC